MKKAVIVPIVTYHSISDANDEWLYRHLSCPVSIFENHLKSLCQNNFHTIPLQTLYDYMAEGSELPLRSVVLTFDDGYLDNWVYAYPLLKKYNMVGTIFVSPEFVDPSCALRPTLENVWAGNMKTDELPQNGFLNWEEMRSMEVSGHIDIQSHALTHTWFFSSPELVDFHHPGDQYPWLAWNAYPERKYSWMSENQQIMIPWGTPVYYHEKSLVARRYFPDENLAALAVSYVSDHGGERFFSQSDWRQQLDRITFKYRHEHGECGYMETDEKYEARLFQELAESKSLIERQLEKMVNFLCWPGGGYTGLSEKIFKEVGYLSSVHSSWDRTVKKNRYGENPLHMSRISPPVFRLGGSKGKYQDGFHLICLLNSIRCGHFHTALYKALKIPQKVQQFISFRS